LKEDLQESQQLFDIGLPKNPIAAEVPRRRQRSEKVRRSIKNIVSKTDSERNDLVQGTTTKQGSIRAHHSKPHNISVYVHFGQCIETNGHTITIVRNSRGFQDALVEKPPNGVLLLCYLDCLTAAVVVFHDDTDSTVLAPPPVTGYVATVDDGMKATLQNLKRCVKFLVVGCC
jgi:hypothetical protein